MGWTESATPDEKQRARLTVARDALVIVWTGVLLGVAFNALGLSSRPPRGLPWITATRSLDSVDSLVRSAGVAAGAHAPPAPANIKGATTPNSTARGADPPLPPAARSIDTGPGSTSAISSLPAPPGLVATTGSGGNA